MEDWIYANTYEKNELLIQRMDENVEYAIRRLESHLEHNYPMNYVDQLAIEIIRKNCNIIDNNSEVSKALDALEGLNCGFKDDKVIHITLAYFEKAYNTIKSNLEVKSNKEIAFDELKKLINGLEKTFNRKGVSSDTDILGTIIKDYFMDNASDTLKEMLK